MTLSVLELVGELNKVMQYYTLDKENMMRCSSIGTNLGISVDYVRTTNCFLTVKTLIHLFGATRGKKINKMSDNCVVELEFKENHSPTYTFLYSGGYMYHSRTAKYTLKRTKINKVNIYEILGESLNIITITNLTNCDVSQLKTNAVILINNALQALTTGKGKHQHDFYTYIFSCGRICDDPIKNGIEHLNNLLSKII
uniref:Uncharacterized protein n=1 Tax=Pithovirus LCPAC403 TaxID=2506596 RepID=A0A481ZD31_9VIRU|nr:MAG: hypothetical protein LCPAC403_03760 [Pithovirus LCPAC403]